LNYQQGTDTIKPQKVIEALYEHTNGDAYVSSDVGQHQMFAALLNNRALGMVRQWQDMNYKGRHSHSYMDSMPDFVKLAEAYGHVGIKVDKLEELDDAMARCFAEKDRLVFMDIAVDQNEHVYPMQIKYGAMDDMRLSKTERT